MKLDRRNFLKLSGITGLSAAAAIALASCSKEADDSTEDDLGTASADNSTPSNSAVNNTGEDVSGGNTTEKSEEIRESLEGQIYYSEEFLRDELIIASSGDGGTFNPFAAQNWGSVQNPLFLNLVANNNAGKVQLLLLKSITEIDELTYDLELWPNITDYAGNNFTASDMVWSVEQFTAGGNSGGVNRLDHLEVLDDYKVRWYCKQAFGPGELVKNFGNPTMCIQKSYEDTGNDMMASNPSGTGPYRPVEYVPGNKVVWEARDNFWFRDVYSDPANKEWLDENLSPLTYQNVKSYEWHILTDAAARATALEMGSVDACDKLNAADVKYFVDNPQLGIDTVNLPVTPPVAFYFNCTDDSPCGDINLRKAICTGIDNAAFAAGVGVPAYEVFGMFPNQLDSPEEWLTGRDYYTYDVEKAQELVKQSGYSGEHVVVMYMSSNVLDATTILFDSQMSAIGINIDFYPVEQTVIGTERYDFTKWDIMFETFGGGSYMSNVTKRWWSENSSQNLPEGINVCGVADPEFDALYENLDATNSPEAIEAWDNWFTYEKCYGYAIIGYYNQTAAKKGVNVALSGSQSSLIGGAFTFDD